MYVRNVRTCKFEAVTPVTGLHMSTLQFQLTFMARHFNKEFHQI